MIASTTAAGECRAGPGVASKASLTWSAQMFSVTIMSSSALVAAYWNTVPAATSARAATSLMDICA